MNILCDFSVYIIYFGIIFKYIFIKKDLCNDSRSYFIYPTNEFCYQHFSYLCGCDRKLSNVEIAHNNKQFIKSYKYCSKIIEISDGHIKFITNAEKLAHIHEYG
ncbi:hypothetical protein BCR36DRAFT_134027 [Piromyces finnis]|uniref:Uncharacterized protein n=1 Tax=Piromyces finnis TaxID=1754191 RepID=A0A1Y1VK16_9FUNG|nr:hypothetical protein BCR36DRAFT_134027 [Piromyces finnis]|eukprot:ORX57718.1 hypothetical protein BCR36DRAFT_134027 [Piromyces finnis]